ncbi:MAG: ABC-F family ATP-binding cassette domain-containing protein [Clostridia bacterium]|nr:ABC-F family ATP-binding cassette domain-containing protein [Clostridia bacterium]
MIVFSCKDVGITFGDENVLERVNLTINEKDRIGIVGSNGAGKTTLIRLLLGEYKETEGTVFVHSKIHHSIGYLPQNSGLESNLTVLAEFMAPFQFLTEMEMRLEKIEKQLEYCTAEDAPHFSQQLAQLYETYTKQGGLTYKNRVHSILKGLGFREESWKLNISDLSGGQKTRLALGRLLLSKPEVLILDEPTNHLDTESVLWLEQELNDYTGTLLIISHDRSFLDAVTRKTLLIENCTAFLYNAPYSKYAILRNNDLLYQERMWQQQQKEIARIEAFIQNQRKWNRERNIIAAESRMKQLDRMVKIDRPRQPDDPPPISFDIDVPGGNDVLFVEDLSFAYPDKTLFQHVSMNVYKGERVFITGPNGSGKSTFLKVLTGMLPEDDVSRVSGSFKIGVNTSFSYYAQDLSGLNSNNTVFDEIYDHANAGRAATGLISVPSIRSALAAFGFRGEEVFKQVSTLSGGEKSRLQLLKIAYERRPFLILDEPTNHLDIAARETLEEALRRFKGTLLVVSHDRYFAEQLATRFLDISSFQEKVVNHVEVAKSSEGGDAYKAEKERRAKIRKAQNDKLKLEKFLDETQREIDRIDAALTDPDNSTDFSLLSELFEEKNGLEEKMLAAMETLENLELA